MNVLYCLTVHSTPSLDLYLTVFFSPIPLPPLPHSLCTHIHQVQLYIREWWSDIYMHQLTSLTHTLSLHILHCYTNSGGSLYPTEDNKNVSLEYSTFTNCQAQNGNRGTIYWNLTSQHSSSLTTHFSSLLFCGNKVTLCLHHTA